MKDGIDKTRFILDHEKGIQYTSSNAEQVLKRPAVAEASAYREVDDNATFVHMELVGVKNPNNLAEWQEDGLTILQSADRKWLRLYEVEP